MVKAPSTSEILLHAAVRTFAEAGYEGATVDMMTARAGVSRAAINYHFRSKEQFFLRALDLALLGAAGWIDDLGWHDGSADGFARMLAIWREPLGGTADMAARLLVRSLTSGGEAEQALVRPAVAARLERLAQRLAGPATAPQAKDRARARLIWALWIDHVRQPLPEAEAEGLCEILAGTRAGSVQPNTA